MSDTPTALLSAERLAAIGKLDAAYASVEHAIGCVRHRRALLAHITAREHQYTETLKGLLVPEPTEAEIWDQSPAGAALAGAKKAQNARIHTAAASLGIDLTT